MNVTDFCRLGAACAGLALSLGLLPLHAGADSKDLKDVKPSPAGCPDHEWTLDFGTGALWSNIREGNETNYFIVPFDLTASMKLDDVSLDDFWGGIFRGYTEFYFRANYDVIAHGPEDWLAGLMVGPRYNFVQPGWKVVPFVQGGIGFDFADSKPFQAGLGQDFNFSFEVAIGVRYDIDCNWSLRVMAEYQHFSNAGLSEPANMNRPIDALGPKISLGYSF